ncbi:MAG: sugar phosphate isomerase/epimerase family protein [Bryobacteraceae bacterium]
MQSSISRRLFLGMAASLAALDRTAGASIPFAAGCRDAMLKHLGKPDPWSAAKAVGAEVIEVAVDDKFGLPLLSYPGRQYTLATDEGIKQLSNDVKESGLKICAFCLSNQFEARADFEVDFSAKVARIAKKLGVKVIRIDVVPRKLTVEQFLDPAAAALNKLIEATKGTGVSFGVENHGRGANNPAFAVPLLERVNSKRFGLTLDVGNFYWYGHPRPKVYELVEKFAPRVVHTHCKSIQYPADQRDVQRAIGWEYMKYVAPITRGDVDYKRVVKILRAAGYKGDLCVENEGLGKLPEADRIAELAAEIKYLKDLRA